MNRHYDTPPPNFIQIRELREYLHWHDLDCRLPVIDHQRRLGAEMGGIVSLRNLVMASLLSGYAVLPSRDPDKHFMFCKVT